MARYTALCFLLAVTLAAARGSEIEEQKLLPQIKPNIDVVEDQTQKPSLADACSHVSFTRGLKYGEGELNVLDIATGDADAPQAFPRPVLLFVMGGRFSGDGISPIDEVPDEAICFAAKRGMVGVKINYRRTSTSSWPIGAEDVAAATSWVSQNIDLFDGDRNAIVAIGYAVGAFHIASLLAHPEFQIRDSNVAGAILVSGIYHSNANADTDEKSYFGNDRGQYDQRSVFPGILNIDTPLLVVWSSQDPPRFVAQGENLRERLCNSLAHCPRTAVLKSRDGLGAYFGLDTPADGLAKLTLELVKEIEARGLP